MDEEKLVQVVSSQLSMSRFLESSRKERVPGGAGANLRLTFAGTPIEA